VPENSYGIHFFFNRGHINLDQLHSSNKKRDLYAQDRARSQIPDHRPTGAGTARRH
jgi:hypothetical protein